MVESGKRGDGEGGKEGKGEREEKSEKQGEIYEIFTRMQYIIYILIRSCMGQKEGNLVN